MFPCPFFFSLCLFVCLFQGKEGNKKNKAKKEDTKHDADERAAVEQNRKAGGFDSWQADNGDRRTVCVDDYKRPELQQRYKGHFLSSVQRLIDLHHSPVGEGGYRELNPAIVLRDHPVKFIGKGLFASRPMKKGEVVWRINGVSGVYHTLADIKGSNLQFLF